jgi:hypothetical protein
VPKEGVLFGMEDIAPMEGDLVGTEGIALKEGDLAGADAEESIELALTGVPVAYRPKPSTLLRIPWCKTALSWYAPTR